MSLVNAAVHAETQIVRFFEYVRTHTDTSQEVYQIVCVQFFDSGLIFPFEKLSLQDLNFELKCSKDCGFY